MKIRLTPAIIVGLVFAASGSGAIIGQLTSGAAPLGGSYYLGFAFTTPVGGPWDNIAVNFYSDAASTTPVALGNLYLFGAAYSGTPAGLAASAFLAQSTGISGGQWLFSPPVALQAGTQYHLYSDAIFSAGSVYGGDPLPGGVFYFSTAPTNAFVVSNDLPNFLVEGEIIPEPGTFVLLGLSLGAVAVLRRWRRA